jgi:hypothetical protein
MEPDQGTRDEVVNTRKTVIGENAEKISSMKKRKFKYFTTIFR